MPVIGFTHPVSGKVVPLDQAADVFDAEGIMPGDAIQAMVDDIQNGTHARGTQLSPSILNPSTSCRRKIVGERYVDHTEDPFSLWAALEGTFFHRTMAEAGASKYEVGVRFPKVELFPGLTIGGEADRIEVKADGTFELIDHKTSRYSKTDFGARNIPEWAIQVNLYRFMYEDLTGKKCSGLWVWRTYRGSYDNSKTFRKFPIPMLKREELWAQIGEWALSLQDSLNAAEAIKDDQNAIKQLVATVRMDGDLDSLFGGQMCTKYCGIHEICFSLAGKISF